MTVACMPWNTGLCILVELQSHVTKKARTERVLEQTSKRATPARSRWKSARSAQCQRFKVYWIHLGGGGAEWQFSNRVPSHATVA